MGLIVAICGLGAGIGLKQAVERITGVCGEVLFIPFTIAAVVAGGIGLAMTSWWPEVDTIFIVLVVVVMWGTAAVGSYGEQLR